MANMNPSEGSHTSRAGAEFYNGKQDAAEDRSVSSRERERDQLQSEVEKFLSEGGKINQVEPRVTADPPKKPSNNYGSRPI